jgi:CDP-diacylglycerol--glycerol-3-phosphate 3-phosphatidyltransferase
VTPPDTVAAPASSVWSVPNLLTLSRLPLSVLLFACIEFQAWVAALATFAVAAVTDSVDGWWARRFNQTSVFGRVFDPLTDKVLIGGAFIFLIAVPDSRMRPWMAAAVIGRELLVTGIRGYVESLGKKFGADWFGKLKTVLQSAWLLAVLAYLSAVNLDWPADRTAVLEGVHLGLLYAMLAATVGSGLQYAWKAVRILRTD